MIDLHLTAMEALTIRCLCEIPDQVIDCHMSRNLRAWTRRILYTIRKKLPPRKELADLAVEEEVDRRDKGSH